MLECCKLGYFSSAYVTGLWRPRTALLTGIVLIVPMSGVRDFCFPKKEARKKDFLEYLIYACKHVTGILCDLL